MGVEEQGLRRHVAVEIARWWSQPSSRRRAQPAGAQYA